MKASYMVEQFCNNWRWTRKQEFLFSKYLVGFTLHVCCGRSLLGDVRLDLNEKADIKACAFHLPFRDKTFDTVLADPPWNLAFIPAFWRELERVTKNWRSYHDSIHISVK